MQWWTDFWGWLTSGDAQPVVFAAVVLLVAIIVSGLLSAWIARGAIHGLLSREEREQKAAAVAALVDAAVEASVWNSLTPGEQVLSDRSVGQADILVRLLPVKGAAVAADWASHQLADLKRNSATYGYSLEPAIVEFRDRLVEWQNKPRRSRRLFLEDLERWRFDRSASDDSAYADQDAWVAQRHHERHASQTDTQPVPETAGATSVDGSAPVGSAGSAGSTSLADESAYTDDTAVLDDYSAVGSYTPRTSTGLQGD